MWSLRAKRVAFTFAFAWIAYGFVIALMAHAGIEKALIKAAMPGGLLLIGAIVAYSAPRVGSPLIIGLGVVMYLFIKQETLLKAAFVSAPPIAVGLLLILSEILDKMRK